MKTNLSLALKYQTATKVASSNWKTDKGRGQIRLASMNALKKKIIKWKLITDYFVPQKHKTLWSFCFKYTYAWA